MNLTVSLQTKPYQNIVALHPMLKGKLRRGSSSNTAGTLGQLLGWPCRHSQSVFEKVCVATSYIS